MFHDLLSYSRLSTWLNCGWAGHQQYNLGFESGLEMTFNVKGKMVHSVVERLLPNIDRVWDSKTDMQEVITLSHEMLDTSWARRLGGSEELAFVKNYSKQLAWAYKQTVDYQASKGINCKAPWMTNHFRDVYAPGFQKTQDRISLIAKYANIVEYEPLQNIVGESYVSLTSYINLIRKRLELPQKLILELDFEAEARELMTFQVYDREDGKQYPYSFRGSIDQLWFLEDGSIYLYDIKTSRKTWTPNLVRHHDQLFLYSKYTLEKFGRLPNGLGILDVRTDKPSLVEIIPTMDLYRKFEQRFLTKITAYHTYQKNELYIPAAGNPYAMCSTCLIGKHGICPHYDPEKETN